MKRLYHSNYFQEKLNFKNFSLTILIIIYCTFFMPRSVSAQIDTHDFPRIANTYLSWQKPPDELAKWDLLVLDAGHQIRYPDQIKKIRKLNSNITILAYITPQEIISNIEQLKNIAPLRYKLFQGLHPEWYLQNSNGKILNWWPDTYILNVTNKSPKIDGERWNSYLVNFVVDEILSTGLWDGIFYDNTWDNITYFAGNNIDADRNKKIDTNPDIEWQEGMKFIYEETRRLTNNEFIIVGNGTTRDYNENLNGKLIENFLPINWGSSLETYKSNFNTLNTPKVNIINSNSGNTGQRADYRRFRFGLGSTLLEDGYYSFDNGDKDHGQIWLYDEYSINLGSPLGDSRSLGEKKSYQPDIWRRDFANGLALVNSTDSQQQIELGGEFEKIHGTQDKKVNDGSIISETTLDANDGLVLLKTFQNLDDITYNNGDFARFFRPDGSRVRNGFFVFDEASRGGAKITRIDIDNNGKKDFIEVRGNKLTIWRDDGQLYLRKYPYTALFNGEISVAIGDIDNDKEKEIIIAPGSGYTAPIKIYSRHGLKVRQDWYPFGHNYTGGFSLAVGNVLGKSPNEILLGTGQGVEPQVSIYNDSFHLQSQWNPFLKTFLGGVNIATGNIDGQGYNEVITSPQSGEKPTISIFDSNGKSLYTPFEAYNSFNTPGINVQAVDVDFDGKDDIVGLSNGL